MIATGDLSGFSLPDLIQIMALEEVTGVLHLEGPRRRARLAVEKGRIVAAACGPKVGEDAVYALFLWDEATFRWSEGEAPSDVPPVTTDLVDLAREGLRRRDAWRAAEAVLPSLDATYALRPGAATTDDKLAAALREPVTIGALGRLLGCSPAEAAEYLVRLWEEGLLAANLPEQEVAWASLLKVLTGVRRRFSEISGLRMTEAFEQQIVALADGVGVDVRWTDGRLEVVDPPPEASAEAAIALLGAVAEQASRLHGQGPIVRWCRQEVATLEEPGRVLLLGRWPLVAQGA